MKIGFTGTQSGMTMFQKSALIEVLEHFKCTEFCHGDCIGSDKQANDIALEHGIKIFTIFPPLDGKKRAFCFNPDHIKMDYEWHSLLLNQIKDWKITSPFDTEVKVRWMPPDSYLERNKHIVDNVEHLIATPKEHTHNVRSGTWATIRYAWKVKRGITIIPPIVRED